MAPGFVLSLSAYAWRASTDMYPSVFAYAWGVSHGLLRMHMHEQHAIAGHSSHGGSSSASFQMIYTWRRRHSNRHRWLFMQRYCCTCHTLSSVASFQSIPFYEYGNINDGYNVQVHTFIHTLCVGLHISRQWPTCLLAYIHSCTIYTQGYIHACM